MRALEAAGGVCATHAGLPRASAPSGNPRIWLLLLLICGWVIGAASTAYAERRVALVMGNAAYQHATPLKNPASDAAKVAELLRKLDFNVVVLTDVDKIGMELALRHFVAEIDGADVALFYYSGHAVQVGDLNYLVPVSAAVEGARSLPLDTIALQDVSSAMRQAGAKVQLLFLDACRDNPFENAFVPHQAAGATRGLARVETATGSLVVFSTSPGQVARDGSGDLSPFTSAFVHYAGEPNLEIRQVLSRVRSDVAGATDNQQVPWDSSSLLGDFYLVPKRPPPSFARLSRVEIASADAPQPLLLAAPVQPEGGPLSVKIEQGPAYGRLMVDSRRVQDDDTLPSTEFTRLAYASTAAQAVDSFSFRVNDGWGNSDVGLVSILRGTKNEIALAPEAGLPPLLPIDAAAVSLVGLGPNLIFRKPLAVLKQNEGRRIQLASNLPFGQIVLGERVIEKGRSLELADVSRLSFLPPAGSEGKHLDALFTPADDPSGEVKVGIDVQMTDCDRLAGDRLDAQGVAEGILTGQIDTAAALPACERALKARPDSARFNYQIGRVYAALSRDGDALAAYRKAADLGYVRAQWALGYHDEYVQPVDPVRGKAMLERAAAAGDVYAIHTLGQVYYEGRGVAVDLEKARGLYETAARMGHTFSMNSLGRMYQRGETVPVDLAMTRRYWEESAARGDMYGIDNMGYVYLDGIDVEKDPAKALTFFKRAADLGHPEAPNNIGRLYVLGSGVPVDYAEARRWYRIGADRGDVWAAYNLGELCRLGKGGPVDPVQAGYYYARAAASINRIDAAELARKELASLDGRKKPEMLRLLLADIDPTSQRAPDTALRGLAQRAMSAKGLKAVDTSSDATLIGTAQAVWIARNARADLF
jgi:TPR repeat protein